MAGRSARLALVLVACATAAALLGVTRGQTVAGKWKTNMGSLATLGMLLRKEALDPANFRAVLGGSCSDYVTTIGTIYTAQFQDLPAEQKLRLLERLGACWPSERRIMLASWTTEAEWALGRYDEVCDIVVSLDAPGEILSLAQQAAEAGNWPAVETTLNCVKRFPPEGAWVSPFIVAPLYNRLGQHYEEAGDNLTAMAAYDAAARWYPVVWAAPYAGKARLLWKQGARQEAIDWLIDGVASSTDVTATFNLWRELGGYWQLEGDNHEALCAYRNALQIVDQVPAQNASEADREQLSEQIDMLNTAPTRGCFEQYPQLQTVQPDN